MQIQELFDGCSLPVLEKQVLLAYVLQKNRTWLFAHNTDRVIQSQIQQFTQLVRQRNEGVPIAYLVQTKEFYSRSFYVNESVLIPRPCTEYLINAAITMMHSTTTYEKIDEIDTEVVCWQKRLSTAKPRVVIDIGTGSGILACTLNLETRINRVIATDCSKHALDIAKINAQTLGCSKNMEFICEANFETLAVQNQPFLVVANPPYIPTLCPAEKAVDAFEPHVALYSGKQGTDALEEIMSILAANPNCIGFVCECRTEQVATVRL